MRIPGRAFSPTMLDSSAGPGAHRRAGRHSFRPIFRHPASGRPALRVYIVRAAPGHTMASRYAALLEQCAPIFLDFH